MRTAEGSERVQAAAGGVKAINVLIPPRLHARLKTAAKAEKRSLRQQIVVLLEQAVAQSDRAAAPVGAGQHAQE